MQNYISKTLSKQKWLLPFLLLTMFAFITQAQVKISGKVTDEKGNGIAGASVSVKNENTGTPTNADGSYMLQSNLKAGKRTIIFSGVGYRTVEQTITIAASGDYTANAQMFADPLGLDEVVVTGTAAGTTKRQLGSYISTIKGDQLTKSPTSNVLAALQGKSMGAQITQNNGDPAGGITVRLRGISSVNSSSEPLYIIDGVIVNNATNRVTNTSGNYDGNNFVGTIGQNRLADINPADIDRIEVLNGAAAAAIYGSRANAGVVQIFTKRGKNGN